MSNLADIRKKKLLSQNDLVKISGVSRSVITKYESGEKDINKAAGATLLKLATALNCKIEDVLERKDKIMEDVLFNMYKEWRKATEEANKGLDCNIQPGSTDCGEQTVREDFSNYANLESEISFDEMLKLEQRYGN